MISNESIRRWVLKFGPIFAKHLRAIRPKAYTRWHLDENGGLNRYAANVIVARCRQRRRCPRDPCPAPPRHGRGGAAAQETTSPPGLCSDGDRYGQTEILRRGA
jgi:hypothetical protein